MILSCSGGRYGHPAPGVLRYEDRLSREAARPLEAHALGEHLALAQLGELPIRMKLVTHNATDEERKVKPSTHVGADLVGKVTEFDGDHFTVDFVRVTPRHRQR